MKRSIVRLRAAPCRKLVTPGSNPCGHVHLHANVRVRAPQVLAACTRLGIKVTAYAPLAKGGTLAVPAVVAIAAAHGVSPAQISLKWLVQHGFLTIPGADTAAYMREDLDLWSWGNLTSAEMARLDGLTSPGRVYNDPNRIP